VKKKVVVLILALFMLLPVSGVFAQGFNYQNGLFDSNPEIIKNNVIGSVKDNILNSNYSGNYFRINILFTEPIDLDALYYNGDKNSDISIKFTFYDGSFESIKTNILFNNYYDITYKKVVGIDIENPTGRIYKINEFDIFSNSLTITPELEEIKEVNAEASHDRIDLSWSLPETEYFEHVNIYRKSVRDVQTFSLLSTDEYDPLFETNGTYFNDFTVEEQTTYDYKLTTEFQGLESEGVTVQATTLVAPPPELGGQEFEEQENGDYLVTWQQPETGQVRILVDGQEYVVVPATDKQYTIPASDMKYSALGDPLVGLQTIGDNGEESEVEQQESNVNLPFGINELLTTSAGLLRVIGSLILLGLSFILVPKFIKVIKQPLNNKKNAETERTEREQRVSERAYREPRESRISAREGRASTRVSRAYRKGE